MKNEKIADSSDNSNSAYGYSIRGYDWQLQKPDHETVLSLVQKFDVSEILARVMVNRGIHDHSAAKQYMVPKLKDALPNPFSLIDMEKAVNRVIQAIDAQEKITVFADYDVDGATSAALLKRFFQTLNITVDVYIPSRSSEGYGITNNAVQTIVDNGSTLLISVDCGSTAIKPLQYAKEKGLDAIVLDHHMIEKEMPDICALVNPKRPDDQSKFKYMAAVGVTFMFTVGVRSSLRNADWFAKNNIEEPDLMPMLDLVALGTVCDVMPLIGINRVFVKCGLHFITARRNPGINAILTELKRKGPVIAGHLGYIIGPRINAGGRVNQCSLGYEILSTDDHDTAQSISHKIEQLNNERRAIEVSIMDKAIIMIEREKLYNKNAIVVAGENWHIGVIGIIASRLKDRYHKPSIVMSISEEGIIKGSGRSIHGVDLGQILCQSRNLEYLIEGGGHAMAGGFTLHSDKLSAWQQYLHKEVDTYLSAQKNLLQNAKTLHIDATLKASGINNKLLEMLEIAAPFGHKNEAPRFAIMNAKIIKTSVNKSGSVTAFVVDANNNTTKIHNAVRCIAFKGRSSEIGNFLMQNNGKTINIAGTMQANTKLADKVDFIIEDIGVVS